MTAVAPAGAEPEERMVDKSPDAFRTISEVAEDLGLPQHVLRFWETRFTQIKPLKRGGGRRYYRPDDVALITGLKALLYGQGYTIKGVQRILKEQGVRAVQAVGRGGVLPQPQAPSAVPHDDDDGEAEAMAPAAPAPRADARAEPARAPSMAAPAPRDSVAHDVESVLRIALAELQSARSDLARALGQRDAG